jgi:hypothetical protein
LSIKVVLLHVLLNDDDEEEEEEEGQRVNIVLVGMQLTRWKCGCCKSCKMQVIHIPQKTKETAAFLAIIVKHIWFQVGVFDADFLDFFLMRVKHTSGFELGF